MEAGVLTVHVRQYFFPSIVVTQALHSRTGRKPFAEAISSRAFPSARDSLVKSSPRAKTCDAGKLFLGSRSCAHAFHPPLLKSDIKLLNSSFVNVESILVRRRDWSLALAA